jgi:predicted nucleic acid-binding protein
MAGVVITDASPLIGLARIDGLLWLHALFGDVWMPREVSAEVISSGLTAQKFVGEAAILNAEEQAWLRVAKPAPAGPELPDLDEGETACIRIALAQPGPILLLMDERAGRAVARELGLRVAGTAAVIGMAKSRGLVPSARDVFARLHASDFRISAEVIATILHRVGE